ncbi:MAG: D-aminoacyl-tRNA deacylase [Nitrososphaerota archaeon]
MKSIFVLSKEDPAGLTIRKVLLEKYPFKYEGEKFQGEEVFNLNNIKLITLKESILFKDYIEKFFKTDLIIFLSRHSSEKGEPSILVHATGNWNEEAKLGGKPKELSVTSTACIREALHTIKKEVEKSNLVDWKIGLEVTHHGPLTEKPSIFIEVGSTIEQWKNIEAAEIIAKAAFSAIEAKNKFSSAVGFGGPHYAPIFTKLVLENLYEIGHIAPKYVFPLNKEIIKKAFEKTIEKPEIALLDWKGLSSINRKKLVDILTEINIKIEKA